jgi:hypothetical protein
MQPTVFTRTNRLITGLAGLLGGATSIAMIGLYFTYSGPPPLTNVLIRTLLGVVVFVGFLIFAVGLARMLKSSGNGDPGMSGSLAITALITYITVTLVAASIEAGTSIWYPDGSMDPTVDGPLSAATVLLHGPIARFLVALFLIALYFATAKIFSNRVRSGSLALAIVNLALVPSLFFGMNPAFFYAANGWGTTATIGAVNMIWFAVLGLAVLRSKQRKV